MTLQTTKYIHTANQAIELIRDSGPFRIFINSYPSDEYTYTDNVEE
jgi:hypothetical protein